MRKTLIALSALLLASPAACAPAFQGEPPLALERTIPLHGVKGRIDHMAVDIAHHKVFVAELGNGSIEALDWLTGRSLGRITGLKSPQGLAYLPARNELVVASGDDGTVRFYQADDLTPVGLIAVGGDADNLRVDAAGRVVVGYGDGALGVIDPASRTLVGSTPLPTHPEGFRLLGDSALVNLPDARQVARVDLIAGRVTATWPAEHRWNFPMALSADGRRFAIVYRWPSRLQLRDAATGAVGQERETCGDANDVFFDDARERVYVICGGGAIDVVDTGATTGSTPGQDSRWRADGPLRAGMGPPAGRRAGSRW